MTQVTCVYRAVGFLWAFVGLVLDSGRGSGQEMLKISWVDSDRVRRRSKSHGAGRVGSFREVFKCHGSGRVTLTRPDPPEMT